MISSPALYHRVFVVVVVHTAAQHCVVDGRRGPVRPLRCRPVDVLLPLTAQDLPEGGAHLLVAVGVDDGVHGRVELSEEQEELFIGEDIAAGTEDVEEEDDQARGPADNERTQYNHHGFQQRHHRISVASRSRAVPRHPHGPLAHIHKDVGI